MQITNVSPESLIEYAFNNRKHSDEQIDLIANSIKDFGFNQPIVVDEDNIILVGHGRLRAAKKLELTEVPVFKIVGLSEIQKRAYRILDNKIQNDSEWDFEKLNIELPFLENEGFDLEAWGLDDLLLESKPEAETSEDEFEPEEQAQIYIKPGDLIELGRHKIICGDCTDTTLVSELFKAGEKARLMNTDPPYGISYVKNANSKNQAEDFEEIKNDNLDGEELQKFLEDSIKAALPYMSENAAYYFWHPMLRQGTFFAAAAAAAAADILIHSQIIWVKPQFIFGRNDYHWRHELCFYGWRKGNRPEFYGPRNQDTIWECGRENDNIHPTQKPLELFARPMRNHTKHDDVVYEPFLGSGSQLIAAEQLDRICYGMEIEPKYCQVIIERYKNHCEKNEKEFVCKVNGKAFDFPN